MKKKGFTLIELLAVIVILAIIALIIVPIVSNVIDSSRKAAFKESVNGMIDSTNNYISEYILNHNNELNEFPVVFTCDGTSCKTSDNYTLTFKGNAPKSGNIVIQRDGVLAEYITDGKYCSYGYKWNLVVEDNCGEVDVTKPTIIGTQDGKVVTLTMTDNESGIDSYCASNTDSTEGCNWVVPSNASSEEYEIAEAGTKYFFTKDKKGNISDSINFTTTSNDYCAYEPNEVVQEFVYTGGVQSYTVPEASSGVYKLEVWGAQGSRSGGQGGYSVGNVSLNEGQTIYIIVGGQPSGSGGGYNGGGSGNYGGGGGATHMASTNRGVLSSYSSYLSEVYIIAGGGGGGGDEVGGGAGGGLSGATGSRRGGECGSYGAGQTGGYSYIFGQGGSNTGGGGGGGLYGGYAGCAPSGYWNSGGGGGSGYIGGVTDGSSSVGGNAGNGKAKITFISLN